MADIHDLHAYNSTHVADHAEHGIETNLDALEELAEYRPDMLNADLLRLFSVRINGLIRQANMAGLKQQLIERGRA
jgi:hypothetical protein